jgi:hypothetical protein
MAERDGSAIFFIEIPYLSHKSPIQYTEGNKGNIHKYMNKPGTYDYLTIQLFNYLTIAKKDVREIVTFIPKGTLLISCAT